MRVRILPYGVSNSARDLAAALSEKLSSRVLRLKTDGSSRFVQRDSDIVINWGKGGEVAGISPTFNSYASVNRAANKLTAFQVLQEHEVRIPDFTTDREEAQTWVNEGTKVVVRHTLRGHSGEGIEIVESGTVPSAPLYVKYIPKQDEYRVHVFQNTIIDVQQKKRSRDVADEDVNWQVRNLEGGFIFAREGVNPPQEVLNQAVSAVSSLGLDFGAVDIVFNLRRNACYVLEVNTACGLSGTTLENYSEVFTAHISGQQPPQWQAYVQEPETQETVETVEPTPAAEPVNDPSDTGDWYSDSGVDLTPYQGMSTDELREEANRLLNIASELLTLVQVGESENANNS